MDRKPYLRELVCTVPTFMRIPLHVITAVIQIQLLVVEVSEVDAWLNIVREQLQNLEN